MSQTIGNTREKFFRRAVIAVGIFTLLIVVLNTPNRNIWPVLHRSERSSQLNSAAPAHRSWNELASSVNIDDKYATLSAKVRARIRVTPTTLPEMPFARPARTSIAEEFIESLSLVPDIAVIAVNCTALFEGDRGAMMTAELLQSEHLPATVLPETYLRWAENCTSFVDRRQYIMRPLNAEEADFPIAFSILMYKDVEQFERLLRAIYRPQNIYCVHVDKKSTDVVHRAVQQIARCFRNIFVIEDAIDVLWGTYWQLLPELICMKELLQRDRKWKYFINLTGQEFPLKTNWQIVRILKSFNGSNNMEGTIRRRNMERYKNKLPAPLNFTITKGAVHIIATRGFVEFVTYDQSAKVLLNWVNDTDFPEETYFPSLNNSPQRRVPGSYLGEPETDKNLNQFLARYKVWAWDPVPCSGKFVRSVCIFGVGDLPRLSNRSELFANKFHIDYQPLTLDCMEELHYRRLREELMAGDSRRFITTFYSQQDFVRNHI